MENNLIECGNIEDKYTSTGRHSGYMVNLYHTGLEVYKHLSAKEESALLGKIHNQINIWEEKWDKELLKREKQSKDEKAKELSKKAKAKINSVNKILKHTLSVNDVIDWEILKHKDSFYLDTKDNSYEEYINFNNANGYPESTNLLQILPMPERELYFTKISFLKKLFGLENKIRNQQKNHFDNEVLIINKKNEKITKENNLRNATLKVRQEEWQKQKILFEKLQNKHNKSIDYLKERYQEKKTDAIIEYCEMVLNNSEYPENFPKDFKIKYNHINSMLMLDYRLPSVQNVPKVKSIEYIKSRDEIKEKLLSPSEHAKLYNNIIYQIILRTFHELFEADTINVLISISINGFVTAVNPSTGNEETKCIVTIQTKKEIFEAINLQGIIDNESYRECFKSLKGIGSAELSKMVSVKPIIEINTNDKRFRDHYDVANTLNNELNVAAMNWEDFEHLVREIFQKEFTKNGGEVRVTQASRDGGVDAIAFDPDPIRGGKIVIQAKRYTNVVGVSAVRDLYGTVLNEGATKGILVTTSDYGADSYDFAKDKPITLLSGSHLLYLLEKHGHKAKIDIKEAKKINTEKS